MIAIVVAVAANNVIGNNNQLAWHLPADLKHFKQLTMGHPMVMGRKTYESIGKPLPGRTTIIVTTQKNYTATGCIVTHSLKEALAEALALDAHVCVVGGAEIYKQVLPQVDTIYLTRLHHTIEGDTYFPTLNEEEWQVLSEEKHTPDEKNKYTYSFIQLKRK